MTLYGDLADSVKWKLCEFVSARPVGGDSNIEYDFALEIIQMVKGQIEREILAEKKWCDCKVINGYIHAFGCSREFAKKRAAAIVRGNK